MKRIFLIFLLTVSTCLPSIHAMADKSNYKAQVDAILSEVQTKSGEYINRFTALGIGAVPALIEKLLTVKKFHITYITPLGKLADKRATLPWMDVVRVTQSAVTEEQYFCQ